jgi:hypothetical protein
VTRRYFHNGLRTGSVLRLLGMEKKEFMLPDELPDATFKRPSWMPPKN